MGQINKIAALLEKKVTKRTFRWTFLLFIYSIVAAIVLNTFLSMWSLDAGVSVGGVNSFENIIHFNTHRPYVYRVLMPVLINFTTYWIPDKIKNSILNFPGKGKYRSQTEKFKERYQIENGYEIEKIITYLILYCFLLLLLFSLRKLTEIVYKPNELFSDFAPVLFLLLYPLTFIMGGYIYDFPELTFLVLSLIFLLRSRYFYYYPILFLAVINKESNILLIFYFLALKYKELNFKKIMQHSGLHFLFGFIPFLYIRMLFADQPAYGPLIKNISTALKPMTYYSFTTIYSVFIPSPKAYNLINLFILLFLVFYKWTEKPPIIKRLFLVSFLFNFPIVLYFGTFNEIRNLSFLFPSLYLLGFHSIYALYFPDPKMGSAEKIKSSENVG